MDRQYYDMEMGCESICLAVVRISRFLVSALVGNYSRKCSADRLLHVVERSLALVYGVND